MGRVGKDCLEVLEGMGKKNAEGEVRRGLEMIWNRYSKGENRQNWKEAGVQWRLRCREKGWKMFRLVWNGDFAWKRRQEKVASGLA